MGREIIKIGLQILAKNSKMKDIKYCSILLLIKNDIIPLSKWQSLHNQRKGNTKEDVEKEGPLFTIDGNDNRHSHNGNLCEDSSKMGIERSYTLTIYFTLRIYPKDIKSYY